MPAPGDAFRGLDFEIPPDRIAQHPSPERDASRLLVLDRARGRLLHHRFRELPELLAPGDLVVRNVSRVIPARLRGRKASGGAVEALLLAASPDTAGTWPALLRHSGRARIGLELRFRGAAGEVRAEVAELRCGGEVGLRFAGGVDPLALGEPPLPPYIRGGRAAPEDRERYQTVYAREPGSVAAPTAGLHLTDALLDRLRDRGVELADVVLHVGPGTFRPVSPEALRSGRLHEEWYRLPGATAAAVAATRARGGRVVAVGTTTTRVLEACAGPEGLVAPGEGRTDLFLRPGSRFRVVDALITNFHLPGSSLLLLVAAFAGRDRIREAYLEALRAGYRFYSYGDAMLILR